MPTQKDTTSAVSSACRRTLSSITSNRIGLENPSRNLGELSEKLPLKSCRIIPYQEVIYGGGRAERIENVDNSSAFSASKKIHSRLAVDQNDYSFVKLVCAEEHSG